jgi:predicted metalloprotease
VRSRTIRRSPAATVAVVVLLGLLAACSSSGGGDNGDFRRDNGAKNNSTDSTDQPTKKTTTTVPAPTTTVDATTTTEEVEITVQPVDGEIDDIIVRETVADLNEWWTQTFPSLYPAASYSPPVAGAWTLRPGDEIPCGSVVVVYDDVADNAIYAPCDDQTDGVFFDIEQLLPRLAASSGQFAPAFVAAHEWGHLIQARGGEPNTESVLLELQADCFAGTWVGHVVQDGTPFEIIPSDIDVALSALLSVADPVGVGATEAGAHGSGFDRVSAFAAGLADLAWCVSFQTDPPPIFEMQFTSDKDAESGGNLPLVQFADLAKQDLETFFLTEIDPNYPLPGQYQEGTCDGREVILDYCATTGTIVFNRERLQAFHDFFGDFATGTLLARAYAATIGVAPQIANCITGAFARELILHEGDDPPLYQLVLSPGDLDEAVRVFLFESMDGDGIFSVLSMGRGILEGLDACADIAQNG